MNKLKVGDRVRYKYDKEHAWSAGSEGIIVELRPEYEDAQASDWQVFYTSPICHKSIIWWTTIEDVIISSKDIKL